jgi:type II secretory pathway pseudopilin PulG
MVKRMANLISKKNNEKGSLLVQTLVAIAIVAIIGTAVLSALSTTSQAVRVSNERDNAANLAMSQMEYIKKLNMQTEYTPASIPSEYVGYSVKAPISVESISQRDSNIQKITITIVYQNREIFTLQDYKTFR